MKTESEITKAFFVLCSDTHPEGLRYCYKAPLWFGMALQDLGANAGRRDVYSDEIAHKVLRSMLTRQNADNVFARRTDLMSEIQREHAARELCRLRGIDPDVLVQHGPDPNPDGSVNLVLLRAPAWTRVLREIVAQEWIEVAVAAGRAYAA